MADTEKLRVTAKIDSRLPGTRPEAKPDVEWSMTGELFMNCSCEVFCPCVISLGKHPPTEGHCHAWMAISIDKGHYGGEDLSGINIGILADIPGRMGEGNWKVGLYIDEAASHMAFHGICEIMSGKAGGSTGVLKYLVGEVLGAERQPVMIEADGRMRRVVIGRKIQGEIEMLQETGDDPVTITNSKYWIGPTIFVARGLMSRVRDRGRVWDFGGRSAEVVPINWAGPGR